MNQLKIGAAQRKAEKAGELDIYQKKLMAADKKQRDKIKSDMVIAGYGKEVNDMTIALGNMYHTLRSKRTFSVVMCYNFLWLNV